MSIIFVDERIDCEEESSLKKLELRILKCPLSNRLYPAVSGHPDMNLHITKSNKNIFFDCVLRINPFILNNN